jgi:hypothetical protein
MLFLSYFIVAIGKSKSSSTTKIEIGSAGDPHITTEEEVNKQILQHEKSGAGVLWQVKTRHGEQASLLTLIKDVVGIVAMLGKVEDANLSRCFCIYVFLLACEIMHSFQSCNLIASLFPWSLSHYLKAR